MTSKVDAIAKTVIYEGYLLYPYRTSNIKNQQRFTFGGVYPPAFDVSTMQTQCLVEGGPNAAVEVTVRFLHLLDGGEVVERTVQAPGLIRFDGIEGQVEVAREPIRPGLSRLTVRIVNTSTVTPADRDDALRHTMLSTHTILTVRDAAFISLTDPPEELRADAAACQNVGTWPVLVGDEGQRDTLLSSPIILEDYPRVAEESPGDLFDGTEMDELLSLSILSLSDDEKAQMRQVDDRARELLARTEALTADDLLKLHASMRGMRSLRGESTPHPDPPPQGGREIQSTSPPQGGREILVEDPWAQMNRLDKVDTSGTTLRPGDRVRLRPGGRADIFDLELSGKTAVIESIENSFDDEIYLAVVLDDDPGKDLGLDRMVGHRFFFRLAEVEAL